MGIRTSLLVSYLLVSLSGSSLIAQVCPPTWNAPFDHAGSGTWPATFNAVHAALIPVPSAVGGMKKGLAFVMDIGATQPNPAWTHRYAVVDPDTQVCWNSTITLPTGMGSFFCSGHCWLPDGRLFIAGGTRQFEQLGTPYVPFLGSKLAYIWDPNWSFGHLLEWTQVHPGTSVGLAVDRWYPTVTLVGNTHVMISGGTMDTTSSFKGGSNDTAYHTYELYNIASGQWELNGTSRLFPGPTVTGTSKVGEFPRMHLLSTGHVFKSGKYPDSCQVTPLTAAWSTPTWNLSNYRSGAASVLFPNLPGLQDVVMVIGGTTVGVEKSVEYIDLKLGSLATWVLNSGFDMNLRRSDLNAVLMPDASIVVVGGYGLGSPEVPVKQVETFRNGAWTLDSQVHMPRRTYHSTALLLPSGNVLSAGGNTRDQDDISAPSDYQILSYDYAQNNLTRPAFVVSTVPSTIQPGLTYWITHDPLPLGISVQKIVLMRPGSTTHHSDMDQRYVELEITNQLFLPSIEFRAPPSFDHAPGGYYTVRAWDLRCCANYATACI